MRGEGIAWWVVGQVGAGHEGSGQGGWESGPGGGVGREKRRLRDCPRWTGAGLACGVGQDQAEVADWDWMG